MSAGRSSCRPDSGWAGVEDCAGAVVTESIPAGRSSGPARVSSPSVRQDPRHEGRTEPESISRALRAPCTPFEQGGHFGNSRAWES